jgi:hypothetical protein
LKEKKKQGKKKTMIIEQASDPIRRFGWKARAGREIGREKKEREARNMCISTAQIAQGSK